MPLFGRKPTAPLRLRFFTQAVCPLCEQMRGEMKAARGVAPYELEIVHLDDDPRHPYRREIPVLEIEGRRALAGRWTAVEFEAAMRAAQGQEGR